MQKGTWENSALIVINDVERTNFYVWCDGPFLHGKKLLHYLRASMIFGKCARYDEKWQLLVYVGEMSLNGKKARSASSMTLSVPQKNVFVKNFTSTDFLGPIRLDSWSYELWFKMGLCQPPEQRLLLPGAAWQTSWVFQVNKGSSFCMCCTLFQILDYPPFLPYTRSN